MTFNIAKLNVAKNFFLAGLLVFTKIYACENFLPYGMYLVSKRLSIMAMVNIPTAHEKHMTSNL